MNRLSEGSERRDVKKRGGGGGGGGGGCTKGDDNRKDAGPKVDELRAARDRAIIPLEIRMQHFRQMLIDKQVWRFQYI